ncbi:sodium-dependent glucose transporter 1-like [Mercenaria mercenaria]|uniref:sodium-dependent glucose transporter 1-like n=1 Tax=Mercenaria mercenaria TaxID=6596 RepID=UPI00234F8A4C|nr:sodium-dependent glucose transporter 1-like [Mercenaria mercenaria]
MENKALETDNQTISALSSAADKERPVPNSNTADDDIDLPVSVADKKDNSSENETVTYINRSFDETSDSEDVQKNRNKNQVQEDVDFIKSDLTELQDVELQEEEYNGALPDPIDLVLQEIGEQSDDGAGERRDSKKLQFSDDARRKDKNEKADEESCSNPIFRYKVWDTIFLFWNTATMGWVYGQMGPALPDLQLIAGVPLQQATWLFTGFAIGYLGGCLLAGFIQDRFNPRLMLFLYTFGTAITIGLLPWIPIFIVMVVIRVVNGICIGGQDTGIHSMLFALWARDGGPFIQMTHVLTALGGIISPLITQPFVREPIDVQSPRSLSYETTNTTLSTVSDNTTVTSVNSTVPSLSTGGVTYSDVIEEDTNVQYAFLITGILVFSAAVPFLVAVLQKRAVKKTTRQYSNESIDKNKLPKMVKQITLVILFVNSFVATAYIDLFPSFLTTFVMGQMNWTQKDASSLTSLYFGLYALGNFIGVFILAYITPTKLIVTSYITSGISILGVLLSVLFEQTELVWVTVALSGITMSGILPTLFTWTQEHVTPITARIASGLLISGSAGVMVNPLLLGYMMEVFSPMWFIYLSLGETVVCALLFATAFTLSRLYSAQRIKKHETSALKDTKPEDTEEIQEKTKIYPRGTLYGV